MRANTLIRFALAIASGVLLALAFPRFDLSLLAWVAFVPLLYAIEDRPLGAVFGYAWLQGFACFCLSLSWIVYTLHHFAHVRYILAIWPMMLLAGAIAIYGAVAFLIALFVARRLRITTIVTLPIAWAALEWLRSFFPIGFPWNLLGYAAYRNLEVIQFSEFTGVFGVGALIMLFNAVVYTVLLRRENRRVQTWSLGTLTAIMIAVVAFGALRVHGLSHSQADGTLKIAMVQGNIAESLKWQPQAEPATFATYVQQSRAAVSRGAQLVVWPETADPYFFQPYDDYPFAFGVDREYRDKLLALARASKVDFLFGAPALGTMDGHLAMSNRAYLVSGQGQVVDYYDKIQLVPFGEYIPLKSILGPFVHRIVSGLGELIPGTRQTIFEVKGAKLGVLICYESIFPDLARKAVNKGAQMLINISNDAWYGDTSAPYQLLAMTSMRAAENKVPIVRVANTGISAVVLPDGEIIDRTPLFERTTEIEKVAWGGGGTVYSAVGDLFSEICFALMIAGLLAGWLRPRRMKPLQAAVTRIMASNGHAIAARGH